MNNFRKISAILLALMVLISSTTFFFSVHYCMGHIREVAFYQNAKGCGMEEVSLLCENRTEKVNTKSCCDNKTVLMEGQHEFASSPVIHLSTSTIAILYTSVSWLQPKISHGASVLDYAPPWIHQDIPILIQSFLI